MVELPLQNDIPKQLGELALVQRGSDEADEGAEPAAKDRSVALPHKGRLP